MSQYMYQMNGLDIEHAELNKLVVRGSLWRM